MTLRSARFLSPCQRCLPSCSFPLPWPVFGLLASSGQYHISLHAMLWLHANLIVRIILDEIHTIGQQEGGAVWEQILLFAPCPIMRVICRISHRVQSFILMLSQWSLRHHRPPRRIQQLVELGSDGSSFQAHVHPPSPSVLAPPQVRLRVG